MENSLKLSENLSKLICETLEVGLGQLKVIQAIHLDDDQCVTGDEPFCKHVIERKRFLVCRDIQGKLNKEKFEEDFERLIATFQNLHDELQEKQTFKGLVSVVDEFHAEYAEINKILRKYEKQKNRVKYIEELLPQQRVEWKQQAAEVENEIFEKFVKKENFEIAVEVDIKYNKDWIKSQLRQNEIKLSKGEQEMTTQIVHATRIFYESEDVHFKVCQFYRQRIQELMTEADKISRIFETMNDDFETKITIANSEKEEFEKMMKIEFDNFEARENEMKAYYDIKRKQQEAKDLLELQKQKILVIQSWWRGEMVRNHLGKFKMYRKRVKQIKKEFRELRAKLKKMRKKK